MNSSLLVLEIAVILLGLGFLLIDLWTPPAHKKNLGYLAAAAVGLVLLYSFTIHADAPQYAFQKMYVQDGLSLFFKRFFLLAAVIVLLMAVEFADRIENGITEFYSLILFALSGMMFASSANDFVMLFVALELITVTFYVLTSFQRRRRHSLEAGVKYLILGALSSAFMVYGIALIFGSTSTTNFGELTLLAKQMATKPVLLLGLLLMLMGLGFKLAAFPLQVWAPDVYQGAPTPVSAFLATGSKAAGVVLLLRVLFGAVPNIALDWNKLLMGISAITILYGNLCAIPQRNLKRLLGYSSIAHAGYILLGITAMNQAGSSAVLYYLSGYLFTVLAAFTVICVVMREMEVEDITAVSGLHQRSPLLAAALGLAMVSLAGIPPLAGFFGKFLLFKAVIEHGGLHAASYVLLGIAIFGVIISFYYYLGVVRAIYWSRNAETQAPILISIPVRVMLCVCIGGMLYLGLFPNTLVNVAMQAVKGFNL